MIFGDDDPLDRYDAHDPPPEHLAVILAAIIALEIELPGTFGRAGRIAEIARLIDRLGLDLGDRLAAVTP